MAALVELPTDDPSHRIFYDPDALKYIQIPPRPDPTEPLPFNSCEVITIRKGSDGLRSPSPAV
jgi:hypothetical protein